jgi:hypothetical protein
MQSFDKDKKMKINRRDYLRRMGAAGMLVGTAGLQGFAREYDPLQTCPQEPPCINPDPGAPRVWEPRWCEDFPAVPRRAYVKLIFEGLMGFAPRKVEINQNQTKIVCDIGFHDKGDSPIHHHLSVRAFNNAVTNDRCDSVYTTPDNVKIKKIGLRVINPNVVHQAYFYQRGRACSRQDLTYYEDFRWIVDFESHYLYGKHLSGTTHLPKIKNIYRPTVSVESGIFYTLRKTASTFRAQTSDGKYVSYLGNVADIIGANVYVADGGYIELTVDNSNPPYKISAPGEIYFTNHCKDEDTTSGDCDFNPYNLQNKKERSDFFLNYKAFDRKSAPEYQLFLAESHNQTKTPDVICERSRLTHKDNPTREDKLNDEAPCSGAGYGGGDTGLPANP